MTEAHLIASNLSLGAKEALFLCWNGMWGDELMPWSGLSEIAEVGLIDQGAREVLPLGADVAQHVAKMLK